MTLLGGQVLPLRHRLGDMDNRLDSFVDRCLDDVKVRLNDDLWKDENDVGNEERRRSVRVTGNS